MEFRRVVVSQQPVLTCEEARKEFQLLVELLVETQRETSLWFAGSLAELDVAELDVMHPQALRVLDQIAVHCSREVWIRVRRLKKWLLQPTRYELSHRYGDWPNRAMSLPLE